MKVLPRVVGIDPAQHVVGAKLDDDHRGLVGQGPVDSGQAAGGSIAADPAIDNRHRTAHLAKGGLQLVGEPFALLKPISGRKAVTKGEQFHGVVGKRRPERGDQCESG